MARKALIVKQQKLAKMRQRYYDLVQKCKEEGVPVPVVSWYKPSKFYNRCGATGKTRGFIRDFGVSRQALRSYARKGVVMGLRKSSW